MKARCKRDVLAQLADKAADLTGLDAEVIRKTIADREQLGSTGVGRGGREGHLVSRAWHVIKPFAAGIVVLVALLALILVPALSTTSQVQSQYLPLQQAARNVTESEQFTVGPLPGDVSLYDEQQRCQERIATPGYFSAMNAAEQTDAGRIDPVARHLLRCAQPRHCARDVLHLVVDARVGCQAVVDGYHNDVGGRTDLGDQRVVTSGRADRPTAPVHEHDRGARFVTAGPVGANGDRSVRPVDLGGLPRHLLRRRRRQHPLHPDRERPAQGGEDPPDQPARSHQLHPR